MLSVVVLQEDNGLVGGHDAPCRLRELIPGRAVRIQLRDVLAIDPAELVADADERELRDVGGPARVVALAEIVPRRESFAAATDDLEKDVRQRSAFSRERRVHTPEDVIQLDLL